MNKLYLMKKVFDRLCWGNKNLIKKIFGQPLKPKWLWFETTDRCNSRCTHCHIWEKKPISNPLTAEELGRALSDPLFSDLENIINSGGEAILREDIEEIIKTEHRILPKAKLDLSTNGIAAERVVQIVGSLLSTEKTIKLNVGVSVDAIGEKHNQIRGITNNFEKIDYLLHKLTDLRKKYPDNLSLVIGLTLSNLTLSGWKEVKQYAKKLNIDFMVQWYNQSSFYDNASDNHINTENNKMIEAVSDLPNTIIREKWLKWLKHQPIKFQCFAADTFCALRCDGHLVPCLNLWDTSLGNVRDQSPTEIWHSAKTKEIKKIIKKCDGCLNSWGVEWSASSSFYPRLLFYLRHPEAVAERIKRQD